MSLNGQAQKATWERAIRNEQRLDHLEPRVARLENLVIRVMTAALIGAIGGGAALVGILKGLGVI